MRIREADDAIRDGLDAQRLVRPVLRPVAVQAEPGGRQVRERRAERAGMSLAEVNHIRRGEDRPAAVRLAGERHRTRPAVELRIGRHARPSARTVFARPRRLVQDDAGQDAVRALLAGLRRDQRDDGQDARKNCHRFTPSAM